MACTIQHKIDCHLKAVAEVWDILSISKIIVETASFSTQKLKSPEIQGEEYRQGEQFGFWNVREFYFEITCQYCHGKSKDPILNVHYLESRKTGGANQLDYTL